MGLLLEAYFQTTQYDGMSLSALIMMVCFHGWQYDS